MCFLTKILFKLVKKPTVFIFKSCYNYISYVVTEMIMKYQQLENLECGWKWDYLVKKYRDGENITKYIEKRVVT